MLYALALILFVLTGQTSKAQYTKAVRGDRVPYDTAVITEIHTYRAESKKLKAAYALLKGYDREVASVYSELATKDSLLTTASLIILSKDRLLETKQQTIVSLQASIQQLTKLALPQRKTWWTRNKFWLGLLAGAGASAYICTK